MKALAACFQTRMKVKITRCKSIPSSVRFKPLHGPEVTMTGLQTYTPLMDLFLKTEQAISKESLCWQTSSDLPDLAEALESPDTFVKHVSILNPYDTVQGRYKRTALASQRLASPYAAAYVDMFATMALNTLAPCFPTYRGAYVGTADKFYLDITDDYEEMRRNLKASCFRWHINTPDSKIVEMSNVRSAIILMERLTDTLTSLALEPAGPAEWRSWVFQLAFGLGVAQDQFGFLHGDLHSSNVMYGPTSEEHFWYQLDDQLFKVPTFGKQLKIIDFGRSCFTVGVNTTKPKIVMSGDLGSDEEACGMVNWGPLRDPRQPLLEPNPSFDLTMLASSLVDLVPEEDEELELFMDELLQADDGTDVLQTPDGELRYEGFDLYVAIAQQCHNSRPAQVLLHGIFDLFKTSEAPPPEARVFSLKTAASP